MSDYNFQYSDMILKIGGQILLIILTIMVLSFGETPKSIISQTLYTKNSQISSNITKKVLNS